MPSDELRELSINLANADQMQATAPVRVPPQPVSQSAEIVSEIATENMTERQRQEQRAQTATETAEESRTTLMDRINEATGVMQSRGRLEREAGLSTLETDIADLTSQIEAREHALRRQIERTETEGGLTRGQIAARTSELNRQAARELADLSIVQNSKLRRFEAVQSAIDRRIKAELEPMLFRLQFDQMFYQENQQKMTVEQDRAFQLRVQEEQRAYDEARRKEEQKGQIMLTAAQFGADAQAIEAIGNSTSLEQAIAAGSQYLGAGFRLQVDAQMFSQRMQGAQLALAREQFDWQKTKAMQDEARAIEETYKQLDIEARKEIKGTTAYEEWEARTLRQQDINQAAITHLGVDRTAASVNWDIASKSDAFVDTIATAAYYTENPTARRPQEMNDQEAALLQRFKQNFISKELGGKNISPNLLRQQVERIDSLTIASTESLNRQIQAIGRERGITLTVEDGAILNADTEWVNSMMTGGANTDLSLLEMEFSR